MYRMILGVVLGVVTSAYGQAPSTQPVPATPPPETTQPAAAGIPDFAFIQISDSHISPHPATMEERPPVRGKESIDWICAEAGKPQPLEPFGITAEAPAFAIHTGDLVEYGAIDETWKDFEAAFAALPVPLYVVPGNHDNTWHAMYQIMRERHGGPNYSFDKFGCHFVGLCSASPEEPLASFEAQTLRWLFQDLKKTGPNRPIFMFFHHPPEGDDFAQPAEWAMFYEVIRPYNVVLMLYGHGHAVQHAVHNGIDGVMGGSTYGDRAGYNVISVKDDTLRVAYRYFDQAKPMTKLLEKPLRKTKRCRLEVNTRALEYATARKNRLTIPVQFQPAHPSPPGQSPPKFRVTIDGKPTEYTAGKRGAIVVSTAGLTPGGHTMVIGVGESGDAETCEQRSVRFFSDDGGGHGHWRRFVPASVKAAPVVVDGLLVSACTDGTVSAMNRSSTTVTWTFETGGEILGTPAVLPSGSLIFGSGDGQVYRISSSGQLEWKYEAKYPVYGTPLLVENTVYIGDNGGRLHAIDAQSGQAEWVFERATYAIESKPAVLGDAVLFGAWDGYLYAVNRKDGSLKWKSWGPKSSEGGPARYYAPADCGPVVLGDRIFVCDRGYYLATYSPDGTRGDRLADDVAAIAPAGDGTALYARSKDDRVVKYAADGKVLWEAAVPAGRIPVPPTEKDGKVYVCSNKGLLSVLDAATGKVDWQYQAGVGFFVMAPVTVDDNGYCYVTSMDSLICALSTK